MSKELPYSGLIINDVEVPENGEFAMSLDSSTRREDYVCELSGPSQVRLLSVNGMDIIGPPVRLYGGVENKETPSSISYTPNQLAVGGIVAIVNPDRKTRFTSMGTLVNFRI